MGDKSLLNDVKQWRDRAEEARLRAEQIRDPEARRPMLGIANSCDLMADGAEQRLRCP